MYSYTSGGCKHGLNAAIDFYSQHGTPYAALYANKPASGHGNVLFQNWSGKYEEIDDVINVIRDRFADTGTDDRTTYFLTWWDEKPTMNQVKRIPLDRPAQSVQFVTATPDQLNTFGTSRMITGANNEVISRLAAIEEKLNAEPETEDLETNEPGGVVGALMQNPAIMNVIQGLIMRAVDKLIPGNPSSPVGIAGVDDSTDKLNFALSILKNADPELEDDLIRLANLSQSDPAQFQFLLKMLRK